MMLLNQSEQFFAICPHQVMARILPGSISIKWNTSAGNGTVRAIQPSPFTGVQIRFGTH